MKILLCREFWLVIFNVDRNDLVINEKNTQLR